MTYSYIQSVFPNFSASKVYNENTYNSLTLGNEGSVGAQKEMVVKESSVQPQPINMKDLLESNFYKLQNSYKELFQDNKQIEDKNEECDAHCNHVLKCTKCRDMITKQLNLEMDRIRNEEIMEIISYMIFGIFVLLIIDNLTTKK